MKLVCTDKLTGKRILVNTLDEKCYKDDYNDEFGKPFCTKVCEAVEDQEEKVVEVEAPTPVPYCKKCKKEYKTATALKAHNTRAH